MTVRNILLLLCIVSMTSCGPRSIDTRRVNDRLVELIDRQGRTIVLDIMPMAAGTLTSPFGSRGGFAGLGSRMHRGLDYGAPRGTEIYAAADGCIQSMSWLRGYGRFLAIEHGTGVATAYAHLDAYADIKVGDCVRKGRVVGYVGTTGNATGPHLHFELRLDGEAVDPQSL